jgi:hypothetical protein
VDDGSEGPWFPDIISSPYDESRMLSTLISGQKRHFEECERIFCHQQFFSIMRSWAPNKMKDSGGVYVGIPLARDGAFLTVGQFSVGNIWACR